MRAIPFAPILAASLMSTCLLLTPATTAAQGSRRWQEGAPTLRVWTYVTGALEPVDRAAARQIADDLLSSAGVVVEWRTCDAPEACSRTTDPSPNVTLILTSAPRPACGTAALERSGLSATVLILGDVCDRCRPRGDPRPGWTLEPAPLDSPDAASAWRCNCARARPRPRPVAHAGRHDACPPRHGRHAGAASRRAAVHPARGGGDARLDDVAGAAGGEAR